MGWNLYIGIQVIWIDPITMYILNNIFNIYTNYDYSTHSCIMFSIYNQAASIYIYIYILAGTGGTYLLYYPTLNTQTICDRIRGA